MPLFRSHEIHRLIDEAVGAGGWWLCKLTAGTVDITWKVVQDVKGDGAGGWWCEDELLSERGLQLDVRWRSLWTELVMESGWLCAWSWLIKMRLGLAEDSRNTDSANTYNTVKIFHLFNN